MQAESNKKSLREMISELSELFLDILTEDHSTSKDDGRWKHASILMQQIITDLMWSTGTLIYIEDPIKLQRSKKVVEFIWDKLNPEEIFDEMTEGGYAGLLVNIMGDYIDSAKMLKPTFISINPDNTEFRAYFEEAMQSWLFGLNNSALILCCSILESLLKENLCQVDVDLVYDLSDRKNLKGIKQLPLPKLIQNAYSAGMLDKEDKKVASRIKDLRNDSVHKLKNVSYKEVYDAIMNSKVLVEKFLGNESISA